MSSRYPNEKDLFETKVNATSQNDPAGDYVMAEHMNDVQDSIVAIQNALGLNPQGGNQNVADRIAKLEGSQPLYVPSFLMYLGTPSAINGSSSIDEAIGHFSKFHHVVFGNSAQNPSDPDHLAAKTIVESSDTTKFYGYIDCSISSETISEIQTKISQWVSMGVSGIYCDKIGYEFAVTREKQNLILDSIHQYGITAIVNASNPDDILTDIFDGTLNPFRLAPNIEPGDIYHFTSFAVDTFTAGKYINASILFAKVEKLIQYRLDLDIRIFGTAVIHEATEAALSQSYFDYAHALAMLCSLDGFYPMDESANEISSTVAMYPTIGMIGSWYTKDPYIKHNVGYTVHERQASFGQIIIDTENKTYEIKGTGVPTTLLTQVPNSIDGSTIKDNSIEAAKISSYNGDKVILSINGATGTIDPDRIEGLIDGSGGISEDFLQANVISAINANIGIATIQGAVIGSLTAGHIQAGTIDAERISGSVVAAINLYAGSIEVGDAKIHNAVISELTADHIKASVIEAINIDAKGANIENLNADNITAGNIAADRIRANVVSAINIYAQNMQVGDARIDVAVIGDLTADHMKVAVIEAVNASIETAKISNAKIDNLTADHIKAVVVEAINLKATSAVIEGAKIGELLVDSMTANVVEAINLSATTALIDGARIRDLNADYITAGSIDADRMTANVIDAINIKAGVVTTGAAIIDSGAIGTLTALHIQANVIAAINASIETADINKAKIGQLDADNLEANAVTADKIAADAVTADKILAGSVTTAKLDAEAVTADKISAGAITTTKLDALAVTAEKIAANAITVGKIDADVISTRELQVDAVETENIKAGAIVADKIFAGAITTEKLAANAITAELMQAGVVQAINLSAQFIDGERIQARTIDADRIVSGSITTTELAAGAVTADKIAANAITAGKIQAGTIDASHISTQGLDAEIINVYNPTTGEVLIGGGYLRVDGLDVGVVQSDNLIINGLFLTASSGYGSWRDNEAGEVILGSQSSAPGGHQLWKIETATGDVLKSVDIQGKKPYGVAIDQNEKYAYITVQGDNTIVQYNMVTDEVTDNMLKTDVGPAVIKYVGGHLADTKHLFALATDPDDANIPDSLMVIDAAPTSTNASLYMHHHLPLGNKPFDLVVDSAHRTYITMADQGDILIFEMSNVNSTTWKVTGRIPITAYATDNYHGGLPGTFGLNAVTGGSAAISYEKHTGHGGGHSHAHGGYGAADGSLTEYEPRGIALSSDDETLYVADFKNNQLVIVDKFGKAYYNPLTGTRERGNLGEWGIPSHLIAPSQGGVADPGTGGGGHSHSVETEEAVFGIQTIPTPPPPFPPELLADPTPQTSGVRDYFNTNGETKYVRYRIDIGGAPEFVECHAGKIFISLSGSGQIAVIDEQQIIDKIEADRLVYYNEFAEFPEEPHFTVRYINVGSKPSNLLVDMTNDKLYVSITGQNQVAKIDIATEVVEQMINVGANPRGMAITQDGNYLYVVNHGGAGSLSFVYPTGNYIGDAYIGMEGQINHHGAHGWMPYRTDWVKDVDGNITSSSTIEFRINEPFLNEGGYVRISAQGKEYQLARIEQDVINVTNYSDGTNPTGTWFRNHNGSAQIAIATGSSPKFTTKFEIDEFVPKVVVFDNQQTDPFTPTADGVNEEYQGLEYSGYTNRALGATITSSVAPTTGVLASIVDGKEPIDTEEETGGHSGHMHSVETSEPVFTVMHDFGETVVFPSGLQNVVIDLGAVYMVGKIVVMHDFHKKSKFHATKTEVSLDGTTWTTVFDSAVDGEYNEYVTHTMPGMDDHTVYGNHIEFNSKPIRYVRDWANGYTLYDADWLNPVEYTENHWTEIKVYGDWEVIYGEVYPPNTDRAGQPLATNGECYVTTDVAGAYAAHDIQIEFTSWSWMTYIASPDNGTMAIEMPSLMSSDHFVDQNWTYKTNVPHKHTMLLTPSVNVKADETTGVKEGKHRIVFKQFSGRVTIDRLRYDDFQYFASSSSLISASNSATFRRQSLLAEQAKAYQGVGRQSTEGAYDEVRTSPDSGLPDYSVPIKYRFRIKCQLDPSTIEERGIAYVTSCIFETGKQSTHWRMSQSGDLFPGTRIEPWDPGQPHKTGIQSHHLANGSVRGSKLMPNSIMNHHISPYARIAEFKLDLNHPTHGHGRMTYPNGPMLGVWVDNKMYLDQVEGWGKLVDDGSGNMVENEYSGTLNRWARADHQHPEIIEASHSHDNKALLDSITAENVHVHLNKSVIDLFSVDGSNNLLWNGAGIGGGGGVSLTDGVIESKHIRFADGTISSATGYGVITEHLKDSAVTNVKIASGIDGAKLAVGSIVNIGSGRITTGSGSILGGSVNVTGDGLLYVGTNTNDGIDGDVIIRNGVGVNVIHLDGDSSGKVDTTNVKAYLAGNGNAELLGTVKIGTLQVNTTTLVANLNAEKINGVAEVDLVKVASINDLAGWGVDQGCEIQAQAIPNMTVKVTAGVVYTSSGRRYVFTGSDNVSLSQPSTNFNRWDVVYVQGPSGGASEGALAVATGTASASPALPTIPTDAVRLADIYVRQNVGTVTDGYNRGSNTPDGSFDAIMDTRVYRGHRYIGNKHQVDGFYQSTKGAIKLIILAGQTSARWTHNYGNTNYVISAIPNRPSRHVYYDPATLTANYIDICIDEVFTEGHIEVMCTLTGF